MKLLRHSLIACLFVNAINMNAMNQRKEPASFKAILNYVAKENPAVRTRSQNRGPAPDINIAAEACEDAINAQLQTLLSKDISSISNHMDAALNTYPIDNKTIKYDIAVHPHYYSIEGDIKTVLKTAAFIQSYAEIENANENQSYYSRIGYWPHHTLGIFKRNLEKANHKHGLQLSDTQIQQINDSLHSANFECTPNTIMPLVKQIINEKTKNEYNFLENKYYLDQTIMYEPCQKSMATILSKEKLEELNYSKQYGEESSCCSNDRVTYYHPDYKNYCSNSKY